MGLVAATRFDDPQEAIIAATALNAAGIAAICHSEGFAALDFRMRQAVFGFPVWVDQDDVHEARRFIAERRSFEPEALAWTRHPESLTCLPLALLCSLDAGFTGWLVVRARQRPSILSVGVVGVWFLSIAGIMAAGLVAAS